MTKEKSRKRRLGLKLWLGLSALVALCAVGNLMANENPRVVRQEVEIPNLPSNFEGFTILQLTDLHGFRFGENQARLAAQINALDYDMLALTGDMNRENEEAETSYAPVYELLRAIELKTPLVFWIDGNHGPYACHKALWVTVGLSEIGEDLSEMGCIVLQYPYEIKRGNQHIWIVPRMRGLSYDSFFASCDPNQTYEGGVKGREALAIELKRLSWFNKLYQNGEVKIGLIHEPEERFASEGMWDSLRNLDYSLLIAGHNHGGQIRIPFYGAFYIPTLDTERGGYFPRQEDVMGLSQIGGTPQYISAGLGASSSVSFLNFRLFNPPEINLIVLRSKR